MLEESRAKSQKVDHCENVVLRKSRRKKALEDRIERADGYTRGASSI